MKKIIILLVCAIGLTGCKNNNSQTQEVEKEQIAYLSFGDKITDEEVISKEVMREKFSSLKEGDTIAVKFSSSINEVCKSKGCWMKLNLGNEKETMVKFKDYGFFMPLDSDDREVIVEGRAYVTKISVEEQQHYAKDAGKSEEEIANITEPEFTYAFEADGVLMKK
ncbi:MAG: DUF4920 domain-containing protein [Flavobacteriaceae bacterium]|nr:DUF4920 domain-containing protein [Flavobacteriaceae bacterium]